MKGKTDKAVRVLQAVIRGEGGEVPQEFARVALEELRGKRRQVPVAWLPPTPKGLEVLRFVRQYTKRLGFAPTMTEIGQHLGGVSRPTVYGHVVELERRGLIKRTGVGRSRNISLTDKGRRATFTTQKPTAKEDGHDAE